MRVDVTTNAMIQDKMRSMDDKKVLISIVDKLVGENVEDDENINLIKPKLIIPRTILFNLIDSYLLGYNRAKEDYAISRTS